MCVLCKLAVGGRPNITEGETPTGKGVCFFRLDENSLAAIWFVTFVV